jgi:hypothetical protein
MCGFENMQSHQINVHVTETPCMEWRVQQTEQQNKPSGPRSGPAVGIISGNDGRGAEMFAAQ